MKDLPVIRTLGGCGGTLLSRMLTALPRTLVLSETNPRTANLFGGVLNPLSQLRKWHPAFLEGLTEFDDAEIGYPVRFGDMLVRLEETTARLGHRLIVRDYNYVDFVGPPFIWPPPGNCSLDLAVEGRLRIRDLLLVRHPADQLASLQTHGPLRHVLSAERFVTGYGAWLDALSTSPRFRYEDLIATPGATLKRMCEAISIDYNAKALTEFSTVTSVTGNFCRSNETGIIAPSRSSAALLVETELKDVAGYTSILENLGYHPNT